jgi:hypothetical protein
MQKYFWLSVKSLGKTSFKFEQQSERDIGILLVFLYFYSQSFTCEQKRGNVFLAVFSSECPETGRNVPMISLVYVHAYTHPSSFSCYLIKYSSQYKYVRDNVTNAVKPGDTSMLGKTSGLGKIIVQYKCIKYYSVFEYIIYIITPHIVLNNNNYIRAKSS